MKNWHHTPEEPLKKSFLKDSWMHIILLTRTHASLNSWRMEGAAFQFFFFVFMLLAAFQYFPPIQLKKNTWLQAMVSLWVLCDQGDLVPQPELLDYSLNYMVFVLLCFFKHRHLCVKRQMDRSLQLSCLILLPVMNETIGEERENGHFRASVSGLCWCLLFGWLSWPQ